MICLNCQRPLKNDLNFKNVFEEEKHSICNKCVSRELLIFNHITLPITNYKIEVLSLMEELKRTSESSWMSFLKPMYEIFLSKYQDHLLLVFDHFKEKDLELVNRFNFSNICVITLTINIKGV